jgi:hypothetical protein
VCVCVCILCIYTHICTTPRLYALQTLLQVSPCTPRTFCTSRTQLTCKLPFKSAHALSGPTDGVICGVICMHYAISWCHMYAVVSYVCRWCHMYADGVICMQMLSYVCRWCQMYDGVICMHYAISWSPRAMLQTHI